MSPKTSASTGSTKGGIRFLAVIMAAGMWFFGLCLGDYLGMSLSRASSLSSAAILCGLAAWLAYHLVGRQNNGLIMIASCFGSLMREDQTQTFGAIVATFLPCWVAVGALIGLTARGLDALKAKKRAAALPGPLYDAQLDHPA
jgi:hypothetical protein